MGLLQLKTGPFHRFGSRYASLIDSDHFLGRNAFEKNWITNVPADVQLNGKEVLVEIALPGFNKDEIQLEIDKNELHISAQRSIDNSAYQVEEIPKKVSKFFQFSSTMDRDNIKANLKNGVLTLTIPYSKEPGRTKNNIDIE